MTDKDELSNIEWKQSKNDEKKTRSSRRFDVKKITTSNEKNNELDVGMRQIKSFFPNNIRKIRSKIREVFDDDEEEEDEINSALFLHMNNDEENFSSLIAGLKEEEKRKLQEDQTIKNQSMQQEAGKIEALMQLDKKLKQSGIKKLSEDTINRNMLNVETDEQTFVNATKQHISQTKKIKTSDIAGYTEANDLLKGLSKVKKADLLNEAIDDTKIEKLDADELIELGKEDNAKKAAKTIYYKTGRKSKKYDELSKNEQETARKKIEKALKENEKNEINSR